MPIAPPARVTVMSEFSTVAGCSVPACSAWPFASKPTQSTAESTSGTPRIWATRSPRGIRSRKSIVSHPKADDGLIFASKIFVQQLREMLAGNVVFVCSSFISHSIFSFELKPRATSIWRPAVQFEHDPCAQLSALVRRPQIGKLAEQIAVRAHFVSCHLTICEDREEDIDGIVSECSAIVREGRRAPGIVGQDVRQQCPCNPLRFLRRITTRVLQRVREDGNETGIIRRLTAEVGSVLRTGKEDSL